MCGLAGIVDFGSDATDRGLLVRMAADLKHRGPDAEGIWRGGPCGLAHRRLSIIDIETSHQPMQPYLKIHRRTHATVTYLECAKDGIISALVETSIGASFFRS